MSSTSNDKENVFKKVYKMYNIIEKIQNKAPLFEIIFQK